MNERENRPQSSSEPTGLSHIDFERRRRLEEIRTAEETERARRADALKKRERAERIRMRKKQRLKAQLTVIGIGLLILIAIIGIIVAVVKAIGASSRASKNAENGIVSEAETALLADFAAFDGTFYDPGQAVFVGGLDAFTGEFARSGNLPAVSAYVSDYGYLAERYRFFTDAPGYAAFRDAVKSTPIFSNGYVWSEAHNMRSSITGSYLYDAAPSFLSAVAVICQAEGSTAFLNEVDPDSEPRRDISGGMTVMQKVETAAAHFFDGKTNDGGLKFNEDTSLVYVLTTENDGTSTGLPSNRYYNFRFGYLDAYINIRFNRAMRDLAVLFNQLGLTDTAAVYADVADRNAAAINNLLWDDEKGRYIGCIDIHGEKHDYGFVFLNLEAIAAGIADESKAVRIFEWLDGDRTVPGDTSSGEDVYTFGFAPRNTTLAASDNWWDYLEGSLPLSGSGSFGNYYQNGGTSLLTAYSDIIARDRISANAANFRLAALSNAYADGAFSLVTSGVEAQTNAVSALAPSAALSAYFSLSTDGKRLSFGPFDGPFPIPDPAENDKKSKKSDKPPVYRYGFKGVTFASDTYGALFDGDVIYLTASVYKPVRLTLTGLVPGGAYLVVPISDGAEVVSGKLSLTADGEGKLDITAECGGNTYLKIVPEAE